MPKPRGPMKQLLTWFGDIKVFGWPFFMVYDPGGYRVTGGDTRLAMDVVRPGDILVRRYSNYLDGYFIPGYFSHAGIYLGEITEDDRRLVPDPLPEGAEFVKGKQIVVHAIAEGVQMEDFLQFCRCDQMAILRFPEELERTCEVPGEVASALPLEGPDERAIFDELNAGKKVPFQRALAAIRRSALSMVGREYDFDFDFLDFSHVSCTELVFYVTRCVSPFLGVFPQKARVLFFERNLIAPDAMVRSPLSLVWNSPSCDPKQIEALRTCAAGAPLPLAAAADRQRAA